MRILIGFHLILAVLLLIRKLAGERLNPRLRYLLWISVPLYLLLAPMFSIPVAVPPAARPMVELVEGEQFQTTTVTAPATYPVNSAAQPNPPAVGTLSGVTGEGIEPSTETSRPAEAKTIVPQPQPFPWRLVLWLFWGTGAAAMLLLILTRNVALVRALHRERIFYEKHMETGLKVWLLPGDGTPFLLGRQVYLPGNLELEADFYRHAVLHEYCHWKQGDPLWLWVEYLFLIVFWWSPLAWLARSKMRQDREMSCDEAVIRILGEDSRRAYAMSLLRMVEQRREKREKLALTTAMFGSKGSLKHRVLTVAKRHRRSLLAALLVLLVLLAALGCGMLRAETADTEGETEDSQETESGQKPNHAEAAEERLSERTQTEAEFSSNESGEASAATPGYSQIQAPEIVSTPQLISWPEAMNQGLKQETTDHMELYEPLSDCRCWALLDEELSQMLQETVATAPLLEDQDLSKFMGAIENELFNATDVMTVWAGGVPYYLCRGTEDRLWVYRVENGSYRISDDKALIETLLDRVEQLTGWKTHTIGELKNITEVTLLSQGVSYGSFTDAGICRNLEALLGEMRPCSAGYLTEYFATLIITTGDGIQHTVVLDPLNGNIYLPWMGFYRFPRMMNVEYSDLMLHGFTDALGLEDWPWNAPDPEKEHLKELISWTDGAEGSFFWLSASALGKAPEEHRITPDEGALQEILRCLVDGGVNVEAPDRWPLLAWVHLDLTAENHSLMLRPSASPGITQVVVNGKENLVGWSSSYDLYNSLMTLTGADGFSLEEHSIESVELVFADDTGRQGTILTDETFLNETALYALVAADDERDLASMDAVRIDAQVIIRLKNGREHTIGLSLEDNDRDYLVLNGLFTYRSREAADRIWNLFEGAASQP